MRRIFNLYINEMIKVLKKPVIIVLAILIFGSSFLLGAAAKFLSNSANTSYDNYYNSLTETDKLNELKERQQMFKDTIKVTEKEYESMGEDSYLSKSKDENYLRTLSDLYTAEFQIKNKLFGNEKTISDLAILELPETYYQFELINIIPEKYRTNEENAKLKDRKKNLDLIESAATDENIQKYIDYKKAYINSSDMKSELKASKLYALDYVKYFYSEDNTSKFDVYTVNDSIARIQAYKYSVTMGKNFAFNYGENNVIEGKTLSQQNLNEFKNKLALTEYKVENGINVNTNNIDSKVLALPMMVTFGGVLVIILIIILAGGCISQEMSSGSIKSLIITPAKRYKIYIAKILSILTILLCSLLVLYVSSTLSYGIFNGFTNTTPYYYADNGIVHTINFYLYNLLYILATGIPMLFFVALALMLSTITRNTATAVGISIAGYFAGNIFSQFTRFMSGEWLKFMPFLNFDIAQKLFPESMSLNNAVLGIGIGTTTNSLTFSLVYILVAVICFGYIGFDSFNRRDI